MSQLLFTVLSAQTFCFMGDMHYVNIYFLNFPSGRKIWYIKSECTFQAKLRRLNFHSNMPDNSVIYVNFKIYRDFEL